MTQAVVLDDEDRSRQVIGLVCLAVGHMVGTLNRTLHFFCNQKALLDVSAPGFNSSRKLTATALHLPRCVQLLTLHHLRVLLNDIHVDAEVAFALQRRACVHLQLDRMVNVM